LLRRDTHCFYAWVFVGEWTLDVAAKICRDENYVPFDTLERMSALLEKSLVVDPFSIALRAIDDPLTAAERDELIAQGRRLDEDRALELALAVV
jgi:hypothetical protein